MCVCVCVCVFLRVAAPDHTLHPMRVLMDFCVPLIMMHTATPGVYRLLGIMPLDYSDVDLDADMHAQLLKHYAGLG